MFWDWGVLSSLPHLPRVVYKDLILSKAKWKLRKEILNNLPANKNMHVAYFKEHMLKAKIPQRISYVEGDNKLLIDLYDKSRCRITYSLH